MVGQPVAIGTIRTQEVSAFNQIDNGNLVMRIVGLRRRDHPLNHERADF